MSKKNERTAKDEQDYNECLRREEPIKTEVIVELREENRCLWRSQARLLRSLLAAEEALRLFREQALASAERCVNGGNAHCTPGCRRHVWDHVDGWHKVGE